MCQTLSITSLFIFELYGGLEIRSTKVNTLDVVEPIENKQERVVFIRVMISFPRDLIVCMTIHVNDTGVDQKRNSIGYNKDIYFSEVCYAQNPSLFHYLEWVKIC